MFLTVENTEIASRQSVNNLIKKRKKKKATNTLMAGVFAFLKIRRPVGGGGALKYSFIQQNYFINKFSYYK